MRLLKDHDTIQALAAGRASLAAFRNGPGRTLNTNRRTHANEHKRLDSNGGIASQTSTSPIISI
jgi:hypothetical protein